MTQKTADARPRGRPRAFDREQALRKAMLLFWRNGYDSTSMSQLVEAMGINSPSIYAAFGGKDDLFREAVELYVLTDGNATWHALAEETDARTAIETMLTETVRVFTNGSKPRGCLIVLGSQAMAAHDTGIQAFLRDQRVKLRDEVRARLARGQEAGELRDDVDVDGLAILFTTFLNGISIETADGASEEDLLNAVARLMKNWPT